MFAAHVLLFFVSIMLSPSGTVDPASHRAEIEAWRQKRLASLRREDGWLSLVGLFWLGEGDNPVGSDPSARVVLPAGKAPTRLGSIWLERGEATWVGKEEGVRLESDGPAAARLRLQSDTGEADPTVLRYGTLRFYIIDRGGKLAVRVKDSDSAARREFRGIENFPVDSRWRVEARLEPYSPPKKIPVPNVLGSITQEESPGALVFELGGRTYRLDPVNEAGATDLFVIFGDRTNGKETYGGGRFLYAPRPRRDGRTVLDFNKAYNPPCVFTPYATCPLPPAQNKLPVRIEAGEKTYGEH